MEKKLSKIFGLYLNLFDKVIAKDRKKNNFNALLIREI